MLAALQPAPAQIRPIEPKLAGLPDIGADYLVPVDITVAADGTVTGVVVSTPGGNEAADRTATGIVLPALDPHARPVAGVLVIESLPPNNQRHFPARTIRRNFRSAGR